MDDKSHLSIEQMLGMAQEISMAPQSREIMQGSIDNLKQALDPHGLGGQVVLPQDAYYAVIDGVQTGPHTLPELVQRVRRGVITPNTYVWRSGLQEWIPARQMEALADEWKELAAMNHETAPKP